MADVPNSQTVETELNELNEFQRENSNFEEEESQPATVDHKMPDIKLPEDEVCVKKEPLSEYAEADSSTNLTTSNSGPEPTTRQSSLQRIQLRKEKVRSDGLQSIG